MPTSKLNNKIAITIGDPSGIGPEIIAKALRHSSVKGHSRFTIIGDEIAFKKAKVPIPRKCRFISLESLKANQLKIGQPNKYTARASIAYLDKALELYKRKEVSSLVTAPLCKEAITKSVKKSFKGHTEYLAEKLKAKNVGMMFVSKKLITMIATRHIPISQVPKAVNKKLIVEQIQLCNDALKKHFKIKRPIIAVCGINPHAGEEGTIGKEELQTVIPAIRSALKKNIRVKGPFAADTLFLPDKLKTYDAVLAMYHDQGLIPIKSLCFYDLVNLTVGLPIVRTSPAHGTAFDIAGKNKADASSMRAAIKLATKL